MIKYCGNTGVTVGLSCIFLLPGFFYCQALLRTGGIGDEANCLLQISKKKVHLINGTKSNKKWTCGSNRPSLRHSGLDSRGVEDSKTGFLKVLR